MKGFLKLTIIAVATMFIVIQTAFGFEIVVKRGSGTSGKLTCGAAGVTNQPCYWRQDKRIPAKTYPGCSTTMMVSKGYKAVFIPGVTGFEGIFIHQGTGPGASDGCIVMAKPMVEKIWNAIPRDEKNITVKVIDD